jgi:hypothetical protein
VNGGTEQKMPTTVLVNESEKEDMNELKEELELLNKQRVDLFVRVSKFKNDEYAKLVKCYRTVTGDIQNPDLIKGWNTVKLSILFHSQDWESVGGMCRWILKNKDLAEIKDVFVVAEAGLLIPPSSVPVEWSFSLVNLIETNIRNRMGEDRLNMHLHIKINTPDLLSPAFLLDASMVFLSGERHGLLNFLKPGQEGTLRLAEHIMEKYKAVWEAAEREKEKKKGDSIAYEGYGRYECYKESKVDEQAFCFHAPSRKKKDLDAHVDQNIGQKKKKRKREVKEDNGIITPVPVERERRSGRKKERDVNEGCG